MGGGSATNHDGAADTEGCHFYYIAYTVKISEMAEGHLWPSVMAFDRSYHQLQAQHGFRWGSDTPHLTAVNLKPRIASTAVTGAMSVKATKPHEQGNNQSSQKKSYRKPHVCGLSSKAERCPFGDRCKYEHRCLAPGCEEAHPLTAHSKNG